jgi:hypothetical protein
MLHSKEFTLYLYFGGTLISSKSNFNIDMYLTYLIGQKMSV